MIYILGHKNPDTDSVSSVIAYSDFLKKEGKNAEPITLGKINNETKFVLDYFGIKIPEIKTELPQNAEVILLDHNEKKQSIDNLDDLNLIEVIDHHKINLKTEKPINVCIKPLGSSCTLIAEKFLEKNIDISSQIAGLLIAGIISDTLFFRSPTTTEKDKNILKKLNKIAKIENLEEFSLNMFQAKSDLGNIKVEDLIQLDYKEFDFNGHRWGIGVMETTNKQYALERKKEIKEKLKLLKKRNNLEGVIFTIIDILEEKSWTILAEENEKNVFQKVFSAVDEEGLLFVDKLVSRKKQIVPKLEDYFRSK